MIAAAHLRSRICNAPRADPDADPRGRISAVLTLSGAHGIAAPPMSQFTEHFRARAASARRIFRPESPISPG
jgi:hypothetical protein